MSNDFNNSESPRIADGAFEAFIENELLPQVGLSRSAFDNLLNQLNITSLSENLGVQPLPSQPVTTGQNNSQWGSLYSALYQEEALPHCAGLRAGQKNNPARSRRVNSSVKDFLDIAFPLTDGSHHDVVSYLVYFQNLMMILADGSTAGLQNPAQFVAKIGPRDKPESILLLQNGQHVELVFDHCGEIGCQDLAGINDVQIEIIKSSRSDLEAQSVSAKVDCYRTLMNTAFSSVNSGEQLDTRHNTAFTSRCGDQYEISGSGHVVTIKTSGSTNTNLAFDQSDRPIAINLIDLLIAALVAATANQLRSAERLNPGPRLIVISDNPALTQRVLLDVEKARRQSRLTGRRRLTVDQSGHKIAPSEKKPAADIRADWGQSITLQKGPVINNDNDINAGANSINQTVLSALHQHGFELTRLTRGLPGNSTGDQNHTEAFA